MSAQSSRAGLIPSSDHWWRAWIRLVEEYSARDLTRDQDKLPAMAGLARKIAAWSGDTYLAGLWRSSLLKSLSWQVFVDEPDHLCNDPEHDAQLPSPTKSKVVAPSSYRAPSWSWAAFDARVKYQYAFEGPVAQVLGCEVIPARSDPFGRLQSGWIKLLVR